MKKNKILKILAGVVAIALICGILFITNAFVGNPISAKIAEKAIKNYVNEKYSFLDLELEKPVYNFKDGSYMVWAKSKTSIDTKFTINYRDKGVYYDSYEFDVLDMHNTLDRLSREYSYIASQLLEKELGYENDIVKIMYSKENYEESAKDALEDILELDMKFDRTLPLKAKAVISMKNAEDISLENISKILIASHETFINNECYFEKYSLYIGDLQSTATVYGVTPEDVESGQLLDLLQQAMDREDDVEFEKNGDKAEHDSGITVFIKTK